MAATLTPVRAAFRYSDAADELRDRSKVEMGRKEPNPKWLATRHKKEKGRKEGKATVGIQQLQVVSHKSYEGDKSVAVAARFDAAISARSKQPDQQSAQEVEVMIGRDRPNSHKVRAHVIVSALALVTLLIGGRSETQASWCAVYKTGGTNCYFTSHAQCQASVSGIGGFCNEVPDGKSGPSRRPSGREKSSQSQKEIRSRNLRLRRVGFSPTSGGRARRGANSRSPRASSSERMIRSVKSTASAGFTIAPPYGPQRLIGSLCEHRQGHRGHKAANVPAVICQSPRCLPGRHGGHLAFGCPKNYAEPQ